MDETDRGTDQKGVSTDIGNPAFSLTACFNERAAQTSEVELKFLAVENNPALFARMLGYFQDRGWLCYVNDDKQLLTRQLDTPSMHFQSHGGATIRVRGNCNNNDLNQVNNADICIKSGKTRDESGAIRRTEYQARIEDFGSAHFDSLRARYDAADHPELHAMLDGVAPSDLQEYFRIDSIHRRFVIELPEEETGLTGKRFVAELALDDCVFLARNENGELLPVHRDQEVESEMLLQADDYDEHPLADQTHSSEMTEHEANRAMLILKNHILAASQGTLLSNEVSKAERGLRGLAERKANAEAPLPSLHNHVVAAHLGPRLNFS